MPKKKPSETHPINKLDDNPPLFIGALKLGWQALRNLVTTARLRGK